MVEVAIQQGVYITTVYLTVYFAKLIGQSVTRRKLHAAYRNRGERVSLNGTDSHQHTEEFQRYYNVTDKDMLGWDRIVGNMLEQSIPFLTLFWINIGLAAIDATGYIGVVAAGWVYVIFRALYPVAWLAGGGGRAGPRTLILTVTPVMYLVVIYLTANMLYAVI
ncbi:unnamed protein product [Ascophyllum nodosum]